MVGNLVKNIVFYVRQTLSKHLILQIPESIYIVINQIPCIIISNKNTFDNIKFKIWKYN